jgi:hypothetical protein
MSKDEYYASTAARLDTIIGGETATLLEYNSQTEWDQLAAAVPVGQGFLTFEDYIREYYGIKLIMFKAMALIWTTWS